MNRRTSRSFGDGVAFVGLSDVLAVPRFLVVTFFAAVRVGFQAAVLALPEFVGKSPEAMISSHFLNPRLLNLPEILVVIDRP